MVVIYPTAPWGRSRAAPLCHCRPGRAAGLAGPPAWPGPLGGEPFLVPLLARAPEAPLPPLVLAHRLAQVLAPEVRPQHVEEHELAVGDLPQQEVRDAVLARGPYEQVRVGHVGQVEVAAQGPLVHLGG